MSTFVFARRDTLRWIEGRDVIARYDPIPPFKYVRCFCRQCGTSLGEIEAEQESVPIPANCLDSDPGVRNRFHEFVSAKPEWYEICDAAPQFPEHPVRPKSA